MNKKNIAGMSLKGGRKDQFYLCLIEHYDDSNRYFLRSLNEAGDQSDKSGNEVITKWVQELSLEDLVVDFPLSPPSCNTCQLDCPGSLNCIDPFVLDVKKMIKKNLETDLLTNTKNPKKYEYKRNSDDEIEHGRDIFKKNSGEHIISRSFKRRLKRDYLPYWNRPLDYWVWLHCYDQLLDVFNISYDSFGTTSLSLLFRFQYLKRHLPSSLKLHESNIFIILIELLKSKIITHGHLDKHLDIKKGAGARLEIIESIEKKLDIFIYENDIEILIKNRSAYESFLLAVSGLSLHNKTNLKTPAWTKPDETNFLIPSFDYAKLEP